MGTSQTSVVPTITPASLANWSASVKNVLSRQTTNTPAAMDLTHPFVEIAAVTAEPAISTTARAPPTGHPEGCQCATFSITLAMPTMAF